MKLIDRVRAMRLTEEEALAIDDNGKYGYQIWANKIHQQATRITDPSHILIHQVIKDQIPESIATLLNCVAHLLIGLSLC